MQFAKCLYYTYIHYTGLIDMCMDSDVEENLDEGIVNYVVHGTL